MLLFKNRFQSLLLGLLRNNTLELPSSFFAANLAIDRSTKLNQLKGLVSRSPVSSLLCSLNRDALPRIFSDVRFSQILPRTSLGTALERSPDLGSVRSAFEPAATTVRIDFFSRRKEGSFHSVHSSSRDRSKTWALRNKSTTVEDPVDFFSFGFFSFDRFRDKVTSASVFGEQLTVRA